MREKTGGNKTLCGPIYLYLLKFVFSKKATKFDEIFTVDLTLTTYCQIDGEDFFNFCGLLRKLIQTIHKKFAESEKNQDLKKYLIQFLSFYGAIF